MQSNRNTKRVRLACYGTNVTMSVVGNLSPLLFLTFHQLYDVSFSLLGTLVLINFATQLIIDLLFSFFSHKFNISLCVKMIPLLAIVGFALYAAAPFLFPNAVYLGIALGTVVFSAGSGLCEVLISPVIAALPSDNPERDMSKLHSVYAWGVVAVVIVTTLFLLVFGQERWFLLPLLFSLVPLFSGILYLGSTLPPLDTPKNTSGVLSLLKNKTVWLMFIAIFLGGAVELCMAQWSSSYLEQALGIDKVWGDIFGMAAFGVTLGLGRSLYAKYGKNIEKVLFLCGIGAVVCYATCILSPLPLIGLVACALTGLCASMMWPGNLVVGANRVKDGGMFIYAMMAAGGDFGAAVGPQLVGIVTDAVAGSERMLSLAQKWGVSIEQLSMKCGMCVGLLFAILAFFVFAHILRTKKNYRPENELLHE